ncbi:MAG: HAMP domain-containing protein, partial [Actinomycetota bacterium]
MSLRVKLLIAVIAMVFAGLLVSDVVTYASLKSFLLSRVDQQLLAARVPMAAAIGEASNTEFGPVSPGPPIGATTLPPGTFGEVRDASGRTLNALTFTYGSTALPRPDLPDRLPEPEGAGKPVTFTSGSVEGSIRYRVLAQGLGRLGDRGTLIVAIPLTEFGRTLGRLVVIEVLVTVVVVAGLGFLSWWLVRRELRPLHEMGETAGAIAAGDLSRRVPEQDPRTEVGQLGVALNTMLAQIERAFAERKASEDRLRRFLADASHELRTPLTSIRGYAELFRRGAR